MSRSLRQGSRARRLALGAALAAALGSASAPALANGRYPNADMLLIDPSNPSHMVLRATFGTLVSQDAGQRWAWICEEVIGYSVGDPAMTVLSDGSMLHAFLGSIMASAVDGCSFSPVPFSVEGRFAIDVTLDPADAARAWVLASGHNGRRQASLLDVRGGAAELRVIAEDFVPSTIEVARSRPERMYIVGFDGRFESTLLVSDDRGASWQSRPITPYPTLPMYLSAIDPANPDVLYVRVDDGLSDHLLVSRDGGASFAEVLTIATDMLGFALSPDGSQVAAGGPGVPLQVASTADFAFSARADIQSIRCLTWAEQGLFACAQESLDNWTLARSTDSGQSFTPLWHVQDLVPLECDPSSPTGSTCPRYWLEISSRIGAELVPTGDGPSREPDPVATPAAENAGCAVGAGAGARALGPWALGGLLAASASVAWRRARRRRADPPSMSTR